MARKLITLTVVAIALAVSLGFAASAKATTPAQLRAFCEAKGGTYKEFTDGDGNRVKQCEYEDCEPRYFRVGSIRISYEYCEAKAWEILR